MASKRDKFGQKYWLAVDKDNKYEVNGFPCVGVDETRSKDERVSDLVLMRLLKPYLNEVGHRVPKIQNQLTGSRKQNPQGSTRRDKAYKRATLLHHTI